LIGNIVTHGVDCERTICRFEFRHANDNIAREGLVFEAARYQTTPRPNAS